MKGCGNALAIVLVPYLTILLALVAMQRSLIFPRPSHIAGGHDHGKLVTLPPSGGEPSEEDPGAVALYMEGTSGASKADVATVMYFHGNADQIGWGGAYISQLLHKHASPPSVYAVEYPGYALAATYGSPGETAIYAAAEAALQHLVKPVREGGLGVDRKDVVLFGQSIGGAVAVEMASRGWGERGLVLLSAFTSLPNMVDEAFPIASPALRVFPWVRRSLVLHCLHLPFYRLFTLHFSIRIYPHCIFLRVISPLPHIPSELIGDV